MHTNKQTNDALLVAFTLPSLSRAVFDRTKLVFPPQHPIFCSNICIFALFLGNWWRILVFIRCVDMVGKKFMKMGKMLRNLSDLLTFPALYVFEECLHSSSYHFLSGLYVVWFNTIQIYYCRESNQSWQEDHQEFMK